MLGIFDIFWRMYDFILNVLVVLVRSLKMFYLNLYSIFPFMFSLSDVWRIMIFGENIGLYDDLFGHI